MASKDRSQMREDHPDSWIAVEAGDRLVGVVMDADRAWSDVKNDGKGGFYPLLTIAAMEATGYEGPPSELRVHCFGAVLAKEVLKCRPEVGETVEFVYRGTSSKEPRKGFNAPELYSVLVPGRPTLGRTADEDILF